MWQNLPTSEYQDALEHLAQWASVGCEWRASDGDELTFAAMLNGAIRALAALRAEPQPPRNLFDVYADLVEAFRVDMLASTKETRIARSCIALELRPMVPRLLVAGIVTHAKREARAIIEFERKKQDGGNVA